MSDTSESSDQYKARQREVKTPTAALIASALAASEFHESEDDTLADKYWGPIRVLHCRADHETLEQATRLLHDPAADARTLGANILAQLGFGDSTKESVCAELLSSALAHENEPGVLEAVLYALGHTPHLDACGRLNELVTHTSPDVRIAVAYALPMHSECTRTVESLITLSRDADDDVRDWATFGLGSQIEDDSVHIRTALIERLGDSAPDPRGEAFVGLAKRNDPVVVLALLKELETTPTDQVKRWALFVDAASECVRAAEESGNPAWLPALLKFKEIQVGKQVRLERSIQRCTAR